MLKSQPLILSAFLFIGCGQLSNSTPEVTDITSSPTEELEQACFYPGRCGDGVRRGGGYEECDDGNGSNADSCMTTCVSPITPSLALGDFTSCALLRSSTIKCWGYTAQGQAGFPSSTYGQQILSPSAVPVVPVSYPATQISGGFAHTCAVLKTQNASTGSLKCWGANNSGCLGLGHESQVSPPSSTFVDLGTGRTATYVSAGANFTCAVLDNGTVKCWGTNNQKELGYNNTTKLTAPGTNGVGAAASTGDSSNQITSAIAVGAGNQFACALLSTGYVRCWGSNGSGQRGGAGSGTPPISNIDLSASAIAVGSSHVCALTSGGVVKCWGSNWAGAVGNNSTSDAYSPVTVDLGTGRTATAIGVGDFHSCAVLDNGTVKCWGFGAGGRLGQGEVDVAPADGVVDNIGDGVGTSVADTTALSFSSAAIAIDGGYDFTCALLSDGGMRCWGGGYDGVTASTNFGQLGDGSNDGGGNGLTSTVPVTVLF